MWFLVERRMCWGCRSTRGYQSGSEHGAQVYVFVNLCCKIVIQVDVLRRRKMQLISLLLWVNVVFYVSHFKRLTVQYKQRGSSLRHHPDEGKGVEHIKRLKHGILVHSFFKVQEALSWVNSSFCWGVELDVLDLQPGFKPSTGYVVIIAWWMVVVVQVEQRGVDTINRVGNQLRYEM